jgi:MSHA biogenesis protein MshI
MGRRKRQAGLAVLAWYADRIVLAYRPVDGRPPTVTERPANADDGARVLAEIVAELGAAGAACDWLLEPGGSQLLQVERPNVPEAEWPAALRWKLRDMLDYPVDEAVVDAFEVPGLESRGRPPSVYAAAARKAALAPRIADIAAAGLQLRAIGISELAWTRAAAAVQPGEEGLAVLALEPQRGCLLVTRGDTLYVPRPFELDAADVLALPDPNSPRRQRVYERVALDVQRTLDYYDRSFQRAPVRRVLIFGGVTGVDGLPAMLRDTLGLEAVVAEPAATFPALAVLTPPQQARVAPVLAWAMAGAGA